MFDGSGKRLMVEIWLNTADQIVLDRYVAEINALVEQDNALMKSMNLSPCADMWTAESAIAALFGSALDRERKFQMIKDNRQDDPPWLTQLVRDALSEIKAAS